MTKKTEIYRPIKNLEGEVWEKENKGLGYINGNGKWVEGDYYVSNKGRRKLKYKQVTKTEIIYRERLSNSGEIMPKILMDGNEWKRDKEFLREKYEFYNNKKRKRKIDKTIAMILYYLLNGPITVLKELDIPSWDKFDEQVDYMFPSEVAYIKKVYDDYTTFKATKKIMNSILLNTKI